MRGLSPSQCELGGPRALAPIGSCVGDAGIPVLATPEHVGRWFPCDDGTSALELSVQLALLDAAVLDRQHQEQHDDDERQHVEALE